MLFFLENPRAGWLYQCSSEQETDFLDFMMETGIHFSALGHVTKEELRIDDVSFGFISDYARDFEECAGTNSGRLNIVRCSIILIVIFAPFNSIMRRIPLLILILLFHFQAFSQEERPRNLTAFDLKRLHFGFTVGFNTMDVGLIRNYEACDGDFIYADLSSCSPDSRLVLFRISGLNKNWNLRFLPGISFGSREILLLRLILRCGSSSYRREMPIDKVPLGPGFLDFPLHFKYRSNG